MSRFFRHSSRRARTALLLLLALVYLPTSGASNHYCFDGKEPPVSVHFDNLNGHDSHAGEPAHIDLEQRVFDDNLVGKFFDLLPVLPTGKFAVEQPQGGRISARTIENVALNPPLNWKLHPPLRAPPQQS